jgi:hypothetical protein
MYWPYRAGIVLAVFSARIPKIHGYMPLYTKAPRHPWTHVLPVGTIWQIKVYCQNPLQPVCIDMDIYASEILCCLG